MDFEESAKEAVSRGTTYGYVPRRLGVEGLPEYSYMPFNVLFSSIATINGIPTMGSALYEPNFSTFKNEGETYLMEYQNKYGGDCRLIISYDNQKNTWHGAKFINGNFAGGAIGSDWSIFFIHFTMLGLAKGEKCLFEKIS